MEIKPPGLLYFLLKTLIRRDMKPYILGDFDEEYLEIAETSGRRRANIWFWKHCLRSFPKILLDTAGWRLDMVRNYLTVALRNMKRQKVFSLINILGLSIALTVCAWIFLFIKDEFSFDRFHKNRDKIYSVILTDFHFNNMRRYIPVNSGPDLKEYFREIKYSVRFTPFNVTIRQDDKLFNEQSYFVDKDFFKMFSFRLIQGDAANALASENTVVLTEALARKYFGHRDPVGKTLTVSLGQREMDCVVSGVTEDIPSNSSIQFKMLMNIKILNQVYGPDVLTNRNWSLTSVFIQLEDGVSPDVIEAGLPAFLEQKFGPLIEDRKNRGSWNKEGPTLSFWLQNLKAVHFFSKGIEGSDESRIAKSYILGGIGILILIIACINYTNLAIGRASTRTVEIGMRKILGAYRKNLIRQFWSESILTVFFSLFLALMATLLFLPLFNRLADKNILAGDVLTASNMILFSGAAVLVGILAGLYPGAVLSRIQPVRIFRKTFQFGGKNILTRLLVVIQFSVSIILVISTLTLSKQIKYILAHDLGYERDGVVVINTFENRDYQVNEHIYNVFEAESQAFPYIKNVSGCVFPLSAEIGNGKLTFNDKRLDFNFTSVHYNFFNTMGITFIAGGDFPKQYPEDIEPVIVTESFVEAFGITDPIGVKIDRGTEIVGVVEDIHFWNLKEKIKPTLILLDKRSGPRNLLVQIDTSDISRAITGLESIWKKAQPNKPFEYTFEDTLFQEKYAEETRWSSIVFYFSAFAVVISCMGLIGITTLTIQRRVKEIGIRRVLGAPVVKICSLLTREYLLLVAVSNFIAWPLAYYLMSRWLNGYAYRTTIDIGIFLLAGILTVIISIVTINLQVYRSASANPVKSLRYE